MHCELFATLSQSSLRWWAAPLSSSATERALQPSERCLSPQLAGFCNESHHMGQRQLLSSFETMKGKWIESIPGWGRDEQSFLLYPLCMSWWPHTANQNFLTQPAPLQCWHPLHRKEYLSSLLTVKLSSSTATLHNGQCMCAGISHDLMHFSQKAWLQHSSTGSLSSPWQMEHGFNSYL